MRPAPSWATVHPASPILHPPSSILILRAHFAEYRPFDEMTLDMLDGKVRFLDVLGVVAGDTNRRVHQVLKPPAAACQSDRRQPVRIGRLDGSDHIRGIAARADSQERL
jgi:hypothetical protein